MRGSYSNVADYPLVGTVGFGKAVARVLEASRVSVAWIPVGICQEALEKTLNYVTEREAFGAILGSNQLVQGTNNAILVFLCVDQTLNPPSPFVIGQKSYW